MNQAVTLGGREKEASEEVKRFQIPSWDLLDTSSGGERGKEGAT